MEKGEGGTGRERKEERRGLKRLWYDRIPTGIGCGWDVICEEWRRVKIIEEKKSVKKSFDLSIYNEHYYNENNNKEKGSCQSWIQSCACFWSEASISCDKSTFQQTSIIRCLKYFDFDFVIISAATYLKKLSEHQYLSFLRNDEPMYPAQGYRVSVEESFLLEKLALRLWN